MPEVDEYGIPIKKTSTPVDEYGIPIRTKEVVVEKEVFGPLPAKTTIAQELPSFQQQQEQVRAPLKYGQAAARDRTETGKLLATTWNNFVGGAESYLAGAVARGAGASPYAGQQAMIEAVRTGKTKTAGEVIKEAKEAPKKQAAIEKEAYKKIEELTGAIKSDYVTPEEQQQISEIDFTNRSFSDNAKALFASGGRLAFDIPMAMATGPTSYYLQSYGESVRDYDKMVEKGQLEPNPLAREFYGNTVGLITSQLEKLGIDKIFGAGPALKNIQRKAIANVFGKIAKSGAPLSAKTAEKLIESEIRGLSANIKAKGIKAAYGFSVEGGTEGLETAMSEGAKIITNKIQGQEVYDEKEIFDNIGKNIFNASVAGGVYGVPMGAIASFGKNVNTSVLKDIANAKTDEDFAKIDNDLEEIFVANNYSPEEREAVATITKNYARIKQKLPPLTPPEVQERVIPLIEQRDKIDEELTAKKENASNLDEAVVADETADIEMLEAKRASINDEIRSEVAGTEFKYFEQDGKFFKQLGENQPEEITKSRFDIESIRQEDKQLAQDEEDAITVLDMMDKPVIINGERATLSQEGQTVIAKIVGKPRIIEIGNIDEIGNQKLSDVGLTQEESAVTLSDTGGVVVRGVEFVNLFTDPLAAINRDANGNVVSVNLETADGKKRTFRGATADDVAYQITLKKITEDNETRQQFEDFVESNESIKQELESGQVAEAPVEAAPVVAEQVPVVAEEELAPANEVERLRAEEQKELLAAIPNIEEYKVNGVVDRNKITNEEDKKKFDEIYNKYDKLITPLIKAEEPVAGAQPVAKEATVVQETVQEAPLADSLKNVESTAKALEGRSPETLIGLFDVAGVINGEDYNIRQAEDVINMEIKLLPEEIADETDIKRKKQLSDRLEYLSKKENKEKEIFGLFDYLQEDEKSRIKNANRYVSVAYHNAKEDGSNPELVKAVEDLVSKKPQESIVKEPTKKQEANYGSGGIVKFAEGVEIPYRYKIIESKDVKPSHLPSGQRNPEHSIALAQPKERGDIQSKLAQEKIAKNPNLGEVGQSPNPYFGAPIVNARGEVIQGNNRSLGLKRHYNEGGSSYKKQLAENAEKFGMTAEQVQGMENPILVRETAIDDAMAVELGNYDVKDLETGGKQRIDPIVTVRKMTPQDKNKLAALIFDGEYNTVKEAIRENQQQVGSLISKQINAAQRNTIFDKEGNINQKGMEDIENIVNNMLFESGPAVLPEAFSELSYNQQKNIQKAIKHIFNTPDAASILPEVQNAVLGLYDYRKSGIDNFNAWLSTIDIFEGKTPRDIFTPVEIKIMETLVKAKNQSELSKQLSEYAELVRGKPADMFEPERAGISKQDAIKKTFNVEYEDIAKRYAEPEGKATDEGTILAEEPKLTIEGATAAEQADFNEFAKRQIEREGFEQQYQAEKSTAYGFTETREQFIARKFC